MFVWSFVRYRFLPFNLVMFCLVVMYYLCVLQPLISIDQMVSPTAVHGTAFPSNAYRTPGTTVASTMSTATRLINRIQQPRTGKAIVTPSIHTPKISENVSIKQASNTRLNMSHCQTSLKYTSSIPIMAVTELKAIMEASQAILNKSTAVFKMRHCLIERTDLLVVIFSKIESVEHRDFIRKTWASVNYIRTEGHFGSDSAAITIVDYLFVVTVSSVTSANQRERLLSEISEERDILPIFLNLEQSNLVALHLIASTHVLSRCRNKLDYVLFQTDDLMPNLPLLSTFIAAQRQGLGQNKKAAIHCFPVESKQPVRLNKRRRYVNKQLVSREEWQDKFIPTYCNINTGGFLISVENLLLWRACSQISKPFRLADIFLTGILSHMAGLNVQPYWDTHGRSEAMMPSHSASSRTSRCLFLTQTSKQPFGVWKTVFQAILREATR